MCIIIIITGETGQANLRQGLDADVEAKSDLTSKIHKRLHKERGGVGLVQGSGPLGLAAGG